MSYVPTLTEHDWKVQRAQENALSAPNTSMEYPVSDVRRIVITNIFSGIRVDTWFVWDKLTTEIENAGTIHLAFVGAGFKQTEALELARDYAWRVYRKDIANPSDPF